MTKEQKNIQGREKEQSESARKQTKKERIYSDLPPLPYTQAQT